jgi:PKD repeat protein
MHGRFAVAAVAATCLLSLTGCDQLCSGTTGVFCPESESNPLNHPPLATAGGGLRIAGRHLPLTAVVRGGTLDFDADYADPDGDALYHEWDLDGDGDFERAGYGSTARHTYTQLGRVRVTLRVSDFPQFIGAPGVVTETGEVLVIDPVRDHAPRAGFTIDPESLVSGVPVYFAGQPVFVDASPSSDPDGYDAGRLTYSFSARDASGHSTAPIVGDPTSPHWGFRIPGAGRWTLALEVTDGAGKRALLERQITVDAGPPIPDRAPTADFGISPGFPGLHEAVTLDAGQSSDPDQGLGIQSYDWDLDGDGSFETRGGRVLHTSFSAPGPRRIGLLVSDGFLRDVTYREIDVAAVERGPAGPTAPVASGARRRDPGLPFSARLTRLGHFHARVLGSTPARRFLNADWRASTRGHSALVLARVRRGAACLRLRLTGNGAGTFTVLGGKGAGARLRATATFRFRLARDGSVTAIGHLKARTGRPRPMPSSCPKG